MALYTVISGIFVSFAGMTKLSSIYNMDLSSLVSCFDLFLVLQYYSFSLLGINLSYLISYTFAWLATRDKL